MKKYILSIDQGTTGTSVLLLARDGSLVWKAYREIRQIYPRPAWVEHDPMEIWNTVETGIDEVFRETGTDWENIDSIGLTNQRETTVLWQRADGMPVHNAIVWQCRRSADIMNGLKKDGREAMIREKTGLLPDAYFSAGKLQWLLDKYDPDRRRSEAGELMFGTIDTWLMYKLSGHRMHLTDHTNASRTLLYNIAEREWDSELLSLFRVPEKLLPEIRRSSGHFFSAGPGENIPVCGVAGDQQAALFGHGAVESGTVKNTYGTGCFMMINTGDQRIHSQNGLLSTIACGPSGEPVYALEGSVFIAGAVIQYLRDSLGLIKNAAETEAIALSVPDSGGVSFVPAFVGLGAPYWDMDARGLITGLTRGSEKAHIVRAALESIAFQTADVYSVMCKESGFRPDHLLADGGATANGFLMQFQADILQTGVLRNDQPDLTAVGAAGLAGIHTSFWKDAADFASKFLRRHEYTPAMDSGAVTVRLDQWHSAVERALLK